MKSLGGALTPTVLEQRRVRLAERLARRNLDAWLLVPGPGLRWATGLDIQPSERLSVLALTASADVIGVVPSFEAERWAMALPAARFFAYRDETGAEAAVARAFGGFGGRAVAFGAEFGVMRLAERAAVEGAVPRARWHPVDADLGGLRQIKDEQEQACLRKAAAIACAAVRAGMDAVVPGASERFVAAACESVLLAHGTRSPFGVHVASGPRGAAPHAATTQRLLAPGDLCWIDLGAEVDGYCADITRTVGVGPLKAREFAAVASVQAARAAALAVIAPGVRSAEVDRAARGAIVAAGLGAYFTHRTGHGLGLSVHEAPYIVEGSEEPLQVGMVFTVEPGVYLPGVGGVRIEDDVLVTADGVEVLTADVGARQR